MSRALDDLSPRFRPLAVEFLARLCEAGIPTLIVDTRRTPEEQAQNIARGVSWTKNSRHLTGDAIDIVPYAVFQLNGEDKLQWDAEHPVWRKVVAIGESLGLAAGARWTQRDMGHFEYVEPVQQTTREV